MSAFVRNPPPKLSKLTIPAKRRTLLLDSEDKYPIGILVLASTATESFKAAITVAKDNKL